MECVQVWETGPFGDFLLRNVARRQECFGMAQSLVDNRLVYGPTRIPAEAFLQRTPTNTRKTEDIRDIKIFVDMCPDIAQGIGDNRVLTIQSVRGVPPDEGSRRDASAGPGR
jgi:hypothetical protein